MHTARTSKGRPRPGRGSASLEQLPVFRHFTHPFKLLPFLLLLLNLAGALLIQRLWPDRRRMLAGVAIAVALLVLFNAGLARQAFYNLADDPYPAPPANIASILGTNTQRVLTVALWGTQSKSD